jgi:hypothetical protein
VLDSFQSFIVAEFEKFIRSAYREMNLFCSETLESATFFFCLKHLKNCYVSRNRDVSIIVHSFKLILKVGVEESIDGFTRVVRSQSTLQRQL